MFCAQQAIEVPGHTECGLSIPITPSMGSSFDLSDDSTNSQTEESLPWGWNPWMCLFFFTRLESVCPHMVLASPDNPSIVSRF